MQSPRQICVCFATPIGKGEWGGGCVCYAFLYAYLKSSPPNKYATNNKRSEATRIINQTRPATPTQPSSPSGSDPIWAPKSTWNYAKLLLGLLSQLQHQLQLLLLQLLFLLMEQSCRGDVVAVFVIVVGIILWLWLSVLCSVLLCL